jgi:hypothetical protein
MQSRTAGSCKNLTDVSLQGKEGLVHSEIEMQLKPGSRWKSAACNAEFVVVRPASGDEQVTCGGHVLVPSDAPKPEGLTADPAHVGAILTGKRYFDEQSGLELLAVKPGTSALAIGGRPMGLREAKALPTSD